MQVEVFVFDHAFGFHELALQKLSEDFVLADDVGKPSFGIQYHMVEDLLYFAFEVFVSHLLYFVEIKLV